MLTIKQSAFGVNEISFPTSSSIKGFPSIKGYI